MKYPVKKKTRYEDKDIVLAESKHFWAVLQPYHDRIDVYYKGKVSLRESQLSIYHTTREVKISLHAINYTEAEEMLRLSKKAYKVFEKMEAYH